MKNEIRIEVPIDGKTITLAAGALAQQAGGACTVQQGDTILFSAATGADSPREGADFFPLQVEYREKFYAAGRFPGGFFKREARPAEKEILTMRLTDRPIRPLFPEGYRNEVQINNMLLSSDRQNEPDVLSITAASTSLVLSEIPFKGPIAGVRVGRVNGAFVVNPTHKEQESSDIDLIYAGTHDLPLMIEGSADEISDADLVAAMRVAQDAVTKLIDAQLELRRALGLPDKQIEEAPAADASVLEAVRQQAGAALSEALLTPGKKDRNTAVRQVREALKAALAETHPEVSGEAIRAAFDVLEIETVRRNLLEHGKRCDGRAPDAIRALSGEVSVLPRTHGSAIFNRGETQALGTVTLGTKSDVQNVDAVTGGDPSKRFMVHYNFPPYSVGECGRLGFTNRREIGHGNLAERALRGVVPKDYPYTVRLVSDIMSCNGSSSMASVCVGSLAMMDAGIPITSPVAGISIGLFSSPDKDVLTADIIGTEDHCGDMDFKVAGTRKGITAFQVDLKITGLRWDLVEGALALSSKVRGEILDFMQTVIAEPRSEMSEHAPRIEQVRIDPEKIGELIGPGGKNIRRITEMSGAQIDIEEDGTVNIFATDGESMAIAKREVEMVSAEAEIGQLYEGRVTGVKEFGAFVEFLPGKDGLVHISELADFRVNNTEDVCKMGDVMWVKCIGVDDRGRVKLSRREAMRDKDQETAG